ncbi:hypothetical protein BRYFOR_09127 [Marvinbryantia formatexigens DSM 14469]|uniref:Uncharacterized protein n=1 Tax=Marvinbryantia formatexigens DSM 14469 TaxID=478749 RepID=C6LKE0_9FIRM|nr:hypothetical protein BRYFOR_09127 [Marvinbryantia formatexigens DSM 14469]
MHLRELPVVVLQVAMHRGTVGGGSAGCPALGNCRWQVPQVP